MLDFVPFMAIVVVVVLLIAGWGVARERMAVGGLERIPEAEAALRECLRGRGITDMPFRVFRDPIDGELVITGPEELDEDAEAALADCDAMLDPFRR